MSTSSISSVHAADTLLVRDVDGQYWPAHAGQPGAARCHDVIAGGGEGPSAPGADVLEHEVFCVLFLDAQHRIIALKQMFRGTVSQTSVYPREVVKEALSVNAAAVILAHNIRLAPWSRAGPTSS